MIFNSYLQKILQQHFYFYSLATHIAGYEFYQFEMGKFNIFYVFKTQNFHSIEILISLSWILETHQNNCVLLWILFRLQLVLRFVFNMVQDRIVAIVYVMYITNFYTLFHFIFCPYNFPKVMTKLKAQYCLLRSNGTKLFYEILFTFLLLPSCPSKVPMHCKVS